MIPFANFLTKHQFPQHLSYFQRPRLEFGMNCENRWRHSILGSWFVLEMRRHAFYRILHLCFQGCITNVSEERVSNL